MYNFNNKLTKSALFYTISTFFNSAAPFLMLPILTRFLNTSEYGVVSMFSASISFLIPFVSMSISTAAIRTYICCDKIKYKIYIFNCILIVFFFSIVVSLVLFIFHTSVCSITSIPYSYIWCLILATTSTAICDLTLAILQIKEKVKLYSMFQNLNTLLNVGMSIILVVEFGLGLSGRIYGIVFAKFFFAILGFIIIYLNVGFKIKIDKKILLDEICNFGLPMIPSSVKSTVLTYTDKVVITHLVSVSATGIYAVGNQLSMPILLLAQAFNLAYVPWLFKKLKEGNNEDKSKIVRLTYCYFVAILLIAVLWSCVSPYVVVLFAGQDYTDANQYIFLLSIGYAFTGMHMMVVNYIYYVKKIKLYSVITIIVIIVNVLLNFVFINRFGTIGAAYATLISNIVSFVLTWILSASLIKMPWFLIKR